MKNLFGIIFDFFKFREYEYFSLLSVEHAQLGQRTGLRVKFRLIRNSSFLFFNNTIQEIVVYDNLHRRARDRVFWTFCPYVYDRQYMEKNHNIDGWGYLINEDSTKHSFIKLTKKEIEDAIDEYCEEKGINLTGNWN